MSNTYKQPNWLLKFSKGSASKYGEAAIIGKILNVINEQSNWCVEFGAGEGIKASNSRNLIIKSNYSAVLIEPHKYRYNDLEKLYGDKENVYTIKEYVHFKGPNTLDNILAKTPIPKDYDFLSIDIDGNDYHVWKAADKYLPKLVCIEYNNTVPPDVEFVQTPDFNINQGSGLLSFYNLAKEKGYELICVDQYNLFFVLHKYYHKFNIQNNSPYIMHHSQYLTYMFIGYDGKIFIEGNKTLPWHFMDIKENKIQHLPFIIRKFPPLYTIWERFIFRLWRFKAHPIRFIDKIINSNNR